MPTNSTPDQDQLFTAVANGNVETLERLLRQGTAPNFPHEVGAGTPDRECITPLHTAASGKNMPVIRLLLAHGADVNAVSSLERTVLDVTEAEPVQRLLLDAGALAHWDLMVQQPVIGVLPTRKPAAPIQHAVTVTRHQGTNCTIRDTVSGEAVGATFIVGSAHVFDAQKRVAWPKASVDGMYIHYHLGMLGEVWTVRGEGSTPPGGEGTEHRGKVVWVRGAGGFQGRVFFPNRAREQAAGAAAAPQAADNGPVPIRPYSSIPVAVHCSRDGRDFNAAADYRANWFFLYDSCRHYGDDKFGLTEEQFRQLMAGQTIIVNEDEEGFRVTPRGPLR
jgi:hypothetical protein